MVSYTRKFTFISRQGHVGPNDRDMLHLPLLKRKIRHIEGQTSLCAMHNLARICQITDILKIEVFSYKNTNYEAFLMTGRVPAGIGTCNNVGVTEEIFDVGRVFR